MEYNDITRARLNIRISDNTLSFSVADTTAESQIVYEPYTVKSGVSIAANLRQAFKESSLLMHDYQRVQVMTDSPVLMIPIEEYEEKQAETLYRHTITGKENCYIQSAIMPNLNVVALFAQNKDLRLVIDDHFTDKRIIPLMQPVWSYLHKRSFTGNRRKLYGYFHDKKLEIFSFQKNRFKYSNVFDAAHSRDAVYFLLYVWQQLVFDANADEMYLVGTIPDKDWISEALHRYVRNMYVINPTAEFNRAPITQIKNLPFDLITYFMKGQ